MNEMVANPQQQALATAIIMPREAQQAMMLAQQLSNARCIPSAFQKSPADVFMVMTVCARYGFDFLPTIWECSIIKGRLFFSGKMVAAMLNASGYLAERLNYEYTGSGDDLTVVVSARISGETTPRSVTVPIKSVRTENENWKRNPEQQIAYAGGRIWGRRHLPEVLLGMMFEGETIDITPTVVQRDVQINTDALAERSANENTTDTGPQPTGESFAEREKVEPFAVERKGDDVSHWSAWAQTLMAYVRAAPDANTISQWIAENASTLSALERYDSGKFTRLRDMIQHQIAMRGEDDA